MSHPPEKLYLTKRSNGIYYVGYYVDGRRRWRSTGKTLKVDALNAMSNLEVLCKEKQRETTLSQFTSEFLAYGSSTHARKTREVYLNALGRFQRQFGDLCLGRITAKHLDLYAAQRLKCTVPGGGCISPVSVNIELRSLRAAMSVAVRWNLLPVNPFRGMHQISTPEAPPTYFTKSDFQALLSAIKEEWLQEVVIFAVLTGMRRGEILNLRWENVNLQRRVILIQSSVSFKTKQGKRRVMPMSDTISSLLVNKFEKRVCDYVFHIDGRQINNDQATKGLKKYAWTAGLNKRLHFHSLRHTFASWLVQDGVSLYEVQKLLGHSNITVTQVYSHLQPEQLHSTVNRITLLQG